MTECRILVVGYEGFSRYWPNPAGELASSLDGLVIGGCRVKGETLPVSLYSVKARLPVLLRGVDAAVGLGLDPSARHPRLELAAVNMAHYRVPDVEGRRAILEAIVDGAPLALPTGLPYKTVYEECSERGLPLSPGLGTGTYLCNTMAYLLHYWSMETGRPAGFIHIPPDTATVMRVGGGYGVPRWLLLETLTCVLSAVARELRVNT